MKRSIIIAGGGTGGHIYPGISIARAIQKIDPNIDVRFVGSTQGLEQKIIPREGFELDLLQIGKLNYAGDIFSKIKTILLMPLALLKSVQLLFKYKPEQVLGVGGYASGPFVLMASLLGYSTAIWEPNAHPGLTNRILSKFVKRCFVVFKEAGFFFKNNKIDWVGLPVRPEIEVAGKSFVDYYEKPRTFKKFHILVFGGSQGARVLNQVLVKSVQNEEKWLHDCEVIHQTGSMDLKHVLPVYENSVFDVKAHEYLFEMNEYYSWADLIICRAGASTIAELAALGKPAIFIPLPNSADDHQLKNAQAVVEKSAGILIEQKNLTAKSLAEKINEIRSGDKLLDISKNICQFYKPQSADIIARCLLNKNSEEKL
jgi:UDP-N-acetylglucosamine--N-acetylmuramyl-(pentapeptide) pyrophosphoryl-undecaprenol N-acetylglucosamine transferase